MTDTPTPLSANEIAVMRLQLKAMQGQEHIGVEMYTQNVTRLIATVEALQDDQRTLDAILAYLGIEDSEADPVDYLRMQTDTIEALRRQLAEANALISQAKQLINEQAEDDGLWFVAEAITETQLQRALRKLSAIIEETDEFGIPLKEPKL